MKCDRCDNEATVHEVTIKGGAKVERHLCEACAKGQGFAIQSHVSIGQLLSQYIVSQSGGPAPGAAGGSTCHSCGITYAEFRQSGLLGCPDCYRVFETQLGPLLSRAHEGGTHHVGKAPRRLASTDPERPESLAALIAGTQERARRIQALRKQIAEAVVAEHYERAAKLRNELRELESPHDARPPGPPGSQERAT